MADSLREAARLTLGLYGMVACDTKTLLGLWYEHLGQTEEASKYFAQARKVTKAVAKGLKKLNEEELECQKAGNAAD
ncbi:MAG: hypothetical protein C4521_12360 [Actinobacteria bacterium]|nr:MAG: hypothetical protein C4521_12360 [Actinomycetota bacterium]